MRFTFSTESIPFTLDIVQNMLAIERFAGAWSAYGNLTPERLTELRRIATIESIGSSTRIEGGRLSDLEVAQVVETLSSRSLIDRDEQEVGGYAKAMEMIFESGDQMPFAESIIKQLHKVLMGMSDKDTRHRSEYKKGENSVAAFDHLGHQAGIVLQTASAFETPLLMQELVDWTNSQLETKKLPPLIIIGMFTAYFLAIHPFEDGNGRLSRVLTNLLLLQHGYSYTAYSSLESIIEKYKKTYYLSLRDTQQTMTQNKTNWYPWLGFFFDTLRMQKEQLEKKIKNEKLLVVVPQLSLDIIQYLKENGATSISGLEKALQTNRNTLRTHLDALIKEHHVVRIGAARATKYNVLGMGLASGS